MARPDIVVWSSWEVWWLWALLSLTSLQEDQICSDIVRHGGSGASSTAAVGTCRYCQPFAAAALASPPDVANLPHLPPLGCQSVAEPPGWERRWFPQPAAVVTVSLHHVQSLWHRDDSAENPL